MLCYDRRDVIFCQNMGPNSDLRDLFQATFRCNCFDVTEFRYISKIEILCHQNHFFRLFHQLQAAVEYFVIVAFNID